MVTSSTPPEDLLEVLAVTASLVRASHLRIPFKKIADMNPHKLKELVGRYEQTPKANPSDGHRSLFID